MAVPNDEIYEKYLQKAIREINDLGDEITRAAGDGAAPVLGSGHPMADIMLLKYGPQGSEIEEGVAFYGRAGQAVLRSLQRLRVDPMAVYGTNCLKFEGAKPDDRSREWLARELHIVQPKLVVCMGEDALGFLNGLAFPLAQDVDARMGELQPFTRSFAPTSTHRSTSSRRRPRSGTRSSPSAPGGPSCPPTSRYGLSR